MKAHHTRSLLLLATLLLPLGPAALAQSTPAPSKVPATISYQGRVLDSSGQPVGKDKAENRNVRFQIWKHSENSDAGSLAYAETQVVTIVNGEFSVLVGGGSSVAPSGATVPSALAGGGELYLGVTVAVDSSSQPDAAREIRPRQQIVSSAYAFRARAAESLVSDGATVVNVTADGKVGVGTTAPSALLTLNNQMSNTKIALSDSASPFGLGAQPNQFRLHLGSSSDRFSFLNAMAGTELLTLKGNGVMGLGTTNPLLSLGGYTGWNGMQVTGGNANTVLAIHGREHSRIHMHNEKNPDGETRAFSLCNSNGGKAVMQWHGPGLDDRKSIFIADKDANITFGGSLFVDTPDATPAMSGNGGSGVKLLLKKGDATTPPCGIGTMPSVTVNNEVLPPGLFCVAPQTHAYRWYVGGNVGLTLQNHNSDGTSGGTNANREVRLGIGYHITIPRAPLHVTKGGQSPGSKSGKDTTWGVYLGPDGQQFGLNGQGTLTQFDNTTVCHTGIAAIFEGEIVAKGGIWAASAIEMSSDARAKQVLGLSDGVLDLRMLQSLKVTDYTWIDRSKDQHRPHKRLIAQDVKEVFPQAVNVLPQPETVPSVYEMAEKVVHDAVKGTLTVTTRKAHGFQAGDKVDLYADKTEMKEQEVLSISGEHQFTVKSGQPVEKLFVYGKQVNDFMTVDYDAISMLNVSATQQLKKEKDAEVAALKAENAALRQQLDDQQKRLKALENADKSRDAKIAALERLIEGAERSSARTVSLKKGTGAE